MQTPHTPAATDVQGDSHGQLAYGSGHHDPDLVHVEDDNINAGLLAVIFALSAVSVLLVVVLLQTWFYNLTNSVTANYKPIIDDPQSLLSRALLEQQEKIKDYHWVNKEAQVRAIPIERAMELVGKELRASQSAATLPAATSQPGKENAKP